MIWRQANRVGLAFRTMITDAPAESDLDARLRRSEKKKRQLQRRIKQHCSARARAFREGGATSNK